MKTLLYKCGTRTAVVVPDVTRQSGSSLRSFLVDVVHGSGAFACHRGVQSTLAKVREYFWWPSMDTLVYDFVRTCEECTATRVGYLSRVGVHTGKGVEEPNERVMFDFLQVRGSFVLVAVDCFSYFIMAKEVIEKNAESVCEFILDWVGLFGGFSLWTSDWEPVFVSAVVRGLRKALVIGEFMGTSYSPSTQGAVERCCGIIKQAVSACSDRPLRHVIRSAVFMNNSTPRAGFADICPGEVFLGRKMKDAEFSFTGELVNNELMATIEEVRMFWRSKVNESRQENSDNELMQAKGITELSPGATVLRVIVDHTSDKPIVRKYGLYVVKAAQGSGYMVEKYNKESGDETEWIPGHQLVVYDMELANNLRVGLGSGRSITAQRNEIQVNESWSFSWDKSEGIRLYVCKDVDIGRVDYGVRYYDITDKVGVLGKLSREVTRTPLGAAHESGSVRGGRWIPRRV